MNPKKANSGIMRYRQILLLFLVMLSVVNVFATNLGVVGQIYPIMEEDFLLFIQNKIALMQKNGEWNRLQNQFREAVSKHADRPSPIRSITHTTVAKTWNFDPSITLSHDLHDAYGRTIAYAGTSVNPLAFMTLHPALIFFDGDDSQQVRWAKQVDRAFQGKVKLILVSGSVIENEKRFTKPIYFDQEGRLVNHFGIQHVPAQVLQNGLKLKISEVVV